MKLSRNIVLSLEILVAHKLRTLLSVIGIVVGVGAVVLMVSAGRGAEKQIVDRIQGMGTNLLIVNAGRTMIIAGRQRQMDTVRTLLVSDALAIARALMMDPALLLADEPTGNLDRRNGLEVLAIFQRLHRQGRTIILVSHDAEVAQHAQRVIVLKEGTAFEDHAVPSPRDAEAELAGLAKETKA